MTRSSTLTGVEPRPMSCMTTPSGEKPDWLPLNSGFERRSSLSMTPSSVSRDFISSIWLETTLASPAKLAGACSLAERI
ncbi:hypothetical protein D3C71_2149710 [compost metagenome]